MPPTEITALPGYPGIVLGTMGIPANETIAAVHSAIGVGYRAFDTAPVYLNEAAVGEALRTAPLPRDELFVTTKLWNAYHGYDEALAAFERTMQRLGLDYVDLYLIHWPVPTVGRYVETWRALVRLRDEGRVSAIGVSNFLPEHLERIADATGVVPAINQIEMHPAFQQPELLDAHRRLGIVTQAWSPLGHGSVLAEPAIAAISARHARSPSQVVLCWLAQRGVVPVVKTHTPGHMAENLAARDFTLDTDELVRIDALDNRKSLFDLDPRTFETLPRVAGQAF